MNSGAVPQAKRALDCRTGGSEAETRKLSSATGFTLHLPLPPSVNALRRTRAGRPLGNRSPAVKTWYREADMSTLMQRKPHGVLGDFEIEIIWDRRKYGRFDCDNRVKVLMDWLQSRELIENDRFCWKLIITWGTAPRGCVVTVRKIIL